MSGTKEGGIKAKNSLIAKLGIEKYKEHVIERGRKGGIVSERPKGFAIMDPEKHLEASSKGGSTSRRTKLT